MFNAATSGWTSRTYSARVSTGSWSDPGEKLTRMPVRSRTDILVNFSTGSLHEPVETRAEYVREVQPDVAALNMGSMNYAKYSEDRDDFVFDMVFENPFDEIRELLTTMQDNGVKPELECFDTGHIGNT